MEGSVLHLHRYNILNLLISLFLIVTVAQIARPAITQT
jgi:hypothetical protein